MSKGRYEQKGRRRTFGSKSLALVLACVLLVGGVIGGTVAWLTAKTNEVTNVFTTSDIGVKLEEAETDFKMIPGWTIDKSPRVTVEKDSEDCWLFVKIEKSSNKAIDDFIEYAIADGWTALNGVDGVYYRTVDNSSAEQTFSVLKDDQVTVKGSVTQAMLQALNSSNYPKVTFTGYAVQRDMSIDAIDSAAEAWALISASNN